VNTLRWAFIIAGLFLTPALAATVSGKPDSVVVTIYHEGDVDTASLMRNTWQAYRNGLAFISEKRTIDLPAGESVIEFRGVASTIVPQTAEINGLPATMIERNFDYDLLSPASLLEKSIGSSVILLRTDRKTGKQSDTNAVVRSAPNGTVLDSNGKVEALGCSGLPEKLVFSHIPDGLRDTPTLSLHVRAPQAGHYSVSLSYIATGMNWSADYVARLAPDGKSLALTGWLTLANFADTGFGGIPVEVVAGKLMTTGEDKPVDPAPTYRSDSCWPTNINWATASRFFGGLPPPAPPPPSLIIAPAAMETVAVTGARKEIAAQELGDYKLYALPESTDLWARRTKQVQFLDQAEVPFERLYTFDAGNDTGEGGEAATTVLRLKNTPEGGLGKPLPAGSVAVYAGGENPLLLGGDKVRDTSVGLPFEIQTGRAMAVRVVARETENKVSGSKNRRIYRSSREIDIANGKREAIVFELRQPLSEDVRIVSESESHSVKPEGAVWLLNLGPGEMRQLRYTTESR
jgi:hypothetical protein